MPQESLRKVVYRSFVTCEDPRGVVEGKTIRLSKTDHTKMSSQRSEKETKSKNSKEKEKEKMSLVEVKHGAQKLNEAIDSWSKGVGFRGQPKDIAKDLLKGALDLQESLMMLGKLQETSCMTNLKKQQEKPSEDLFSGTGSDRFESFRTYDSGYQKERKLANGSSRDCYTELRDVIREGLLKQNLLPNKSLKESAFADRDTEELAGKRKLQLSPDIASTSSSRSSSMVYSTHEFTSSESFSSRATEEKSKGSNLIAKLMGLEAFPSKPLPSSSKKPLDMNSKTRPVSNVDLPNAKKPQFFVQKLDREHMSLNEIIEAMQSKGHLRSNNQEIKQTSKRFMDDAPPIVLMKPQRLGPDNQKFKGYENPIRKLHQEKAKTEDKCINNREKPKLPSNKQKASVPVVTRSQRKQETEKKIDKIQKMTPPVKRKPVENAKSANLNSKNNALKQVKPQRTVIQNPVLKQTSSSVLSTNKSNNKMNTNKIKKPVNQPCTTIIREVLEINLSNQEETQDAEVTSKEIEIEKVGQQSLCDTFRKDSHFVKDAIVGMDHSEIRNNQEESGIYDVRERKARILKTITSFQDCEPANFELFQDCVNEFLEHENQKQNPLLQRSMLSSRVCTWEDQMVREIVRKLENLRNYNKFSKESCNADSVSELLERDLNLSTIGGAWSSTGWKDGCTVNEVEEAVLDLEKMVLSKLIDDMLMELVS